jgi:hypothetical protein
MLLAKTRPVLKKSFLH